jgi:2-(1,2-epoxy-1,2-dihydrophenyl)acetyl-CoA isomerase
MTDPLVHHAVADGVAWITLDRPDKLNALTTAMLETLLATLTAAAAADEVRAVRLTGRGRGFCVGQDLSDRNVAADAAPPDLGASLEERYNPIVRAMRTLPKPVVVAVNGVAAGAGANLALAGDLVVAARSATFIESFARVGLVPDAGGTYFLPRLVGTARAAGLALLGEPLPAARAAEWGLIWEVVEDDRLETYTAELARRLAAGPTAGFAATKAALAASAGNDLDAQLDLERDLQRACGRTADYREGVRAFFERRDPEFTGR